MPDTADEKKEKKRVPTGKTCRCGVPLYEDDDVIHCCWCGWIVHRKCEHGVRYCSERCEEEGL